MSDTHHPTPVDLTGESSVLSATPSRPSRAADGALAPLADRARVLVVCRESNEFDTVLMDAMVQQTLHYVPDHPAVHQARELGLKPLLTPDSLLPGVNRVVLKRGRAVATLFEIDGHFFLYSMTSAAKSNSSGENDWTNICVEVLSALRPIAVYVASVSRLVRSFEHTGTLLSSISKNVDVIHAGLTIMRMRGQEAEMGHIMWAMLATVATSERNLIVQRLTAGVVAKYRRGEWIKGKGAIPLGYRLDPTSRTLVVDPDAQPALELAWTLMADPAVPSWKILQRLGDLGVSSPLARQRYGEDATVANLVDAETYLEQLRRWSRLYLTGEHITRWTNPFEGVPHIAGMPVHPTEDGRGELRFAYAFERPDIDPGLIQAGLDAQKTRAANPTTGGAARSRITPLNGHHWLQDGLEYWLTTSRSGSYDLRVRGIEEAS